MAAVGSPETSPITLNNPDGRRTFEPARAPPWLPASALLPSPAYSPLVHSVDEPSPRSCSQTQCARRVHVVGVALSNDVGRASGSDFECNGTKNAACDDPSGRPGDSTGSQRTPKQVPVTVPAAVAGSWLSTMEIPGLGALNGTSTWNDGQVLSAADATAPVASRAEEPTLRGGHQQQRQHVLARGPDGNLRIVNLQRHVGDWDPPWPYAVLPCVYEEDPFSFEVYSEDVVSY